MMLMRAAKSCAKCPPSRSRILTSAATVPVCNAFSTAGQILSALDQFLVALKNPRRADDLIQRHGLGNFQMFGQLRQFRGISARPVFC